MKKLFEITEGLDVSEILNITHYEKPIPSQLNGTAKGNFPSFLSKTDENRIQNCPKMIKELQGKPYYISVKCDGTSGTFYKQEKTFGVCSRNLEMKLNKDNSYWKIAGKYKLETISNGMCVQGEICGPGIQKNPMQLNDLDLFVFNIYEIEGHRNLSLNEMKEFCKKHNLNMVPIQEEGESFDYSSIEELLLEACGWYENTTTDKEGIVIRSQDMSISFKVINNDYLIKNKE